MIAGLIPTFLVACFGGVLVELLKMVQPERESPRFPTYTKNTVYWLLTVMMILAGGGLALLYGTERRARCLLRISACPHH